VGTVPVWAGYGYTFMPMSSTHTLPVKSWIGYECSFVPVGILIPCSFIVNFLRDMSTFVTYELLYENEIFIFLIVMY
jgi:hypothetical protein